MLRIVMQKQIKKMHMHKIKLSFAKKIKFNIKIIFVVENKLNYFSQFKFNWIPNKFDLKLGKIKIV